MYLKYLKSVLAHKYYVFRAGLKIGGIPIWRLLIHDWTKFGPTEFPRYADYHFGDFKDRKKWSEAWLHHANHNPHHHEYWVLRWFGEDQYFYQGVGVKVADWVVALEIPETYLREMVADWMGASKNYAGTWDCRGYILPRMDRMNIHPKSKARLLEIMSETYE